MSTPSAHDRERFVRLWYRLKIMGYVEAAWQRIATAYTEPHRRYHNWDHIAWCLEQFDRIKHLLDDPDEVEFAIFLHDAVYIPGAQDNEERSADLAYDFLKKTPNRSLIIAVEMLILGTKHRHEPVTQDGRYMVDIDVSSMGDPEENARYVATVREEFLQFVSEEDYERGRRKFITEFLKRDPIYYTDFFHQRYEAAAKRHLAEQLEE